MRKQDRQGVRTPADLERKYPLGNIPSGQATNNAMLAKQVEQLTTTLAQFMGRTNGTLADLSQAVEDLRTYVEEKFATLHPDPSVTHSIVNNLSGCTSSNTSATITQGSAYVASISCDEGLTITNVSVIMGTRDITASVCTYTGSGTVNISIASVIGDIVITAEGGGA
jgi:hypothetical protein